MYRSLNDSWEYDAMRDLISHEDISFDFDYRTPYTWWMDKIDNKLSKPEKWDLIILVGYPSMWKTQFTWFSALKNAKKWNMTAYITLELTKKQFLQRNARKVAWVSMIDFQNWKYSKEQMEIMKQQLSVNSNLENLQIISWSEKPTEEYVMDMLHTLVDNWYIDIYIDNLWKIWECATDYDAQARFTSRLQDFKNENDVKILLVHHLKKPSKQWVYLPGWWTAFSWNMKILDNCTKMLEVWRDLDPYAWADVKYETKLIQYKDTWEWIASHVSIYFHEWTYHPEKMNTPF